MADAAPTETVEYLSVCSGIEAATVAWQPLGWSAYGFSEIERFPSAVLQHHYSHTPNYGDMNDFRKWPKANIDVLVGGTPCQSFSVAGLRQGMADPRGNLALVYLALTEQYRPRWLVWENVPGVLSSNGGRDFGSIIGGMVELGYGIAYRVLDAQYFGVPQRRRRVFVIGYLGDWRRAAQVLFEPQSLRRNPPPSREARQIAPTVPSRSTAGGGLGTDFDCDGGLIHCPDVSPAMKARDLRGEGFDASEDGTGRGTPIVVHGTQDPRTGDQVFVFKQGQGAKAGSIGGNENIAPTLGAAESGTNRTPALMNGAAVRRLTPLECERLQGFPDGYTDIPGASELLSNLVYADEIKRRPGWLVRSLLR